MLSLPKDRVSLVSVRSRTAAVAGFPRSFWVGTGRYQSS